VTTSPAKAGGVMTNDANSANDRRKALVKVSSMALPGTYVARLTVPTPG
jgi:hypothetical protein